MPSHEESLEEIGKALRSLANHLPEAARSDHPLQKSSIEDAAHIIAGAIETAGNDIASAIHELAKAYRASLP